MEITINLEMDQLHNKIEGILKLTTGGSHIGEKGLVM